MNYNSFKVTAATALLSATLFGSPLLGDAHGNGRGDGRGDGHKDGKRTHQMIDRKHDRNEHRQEQNHRGYENTNWDKKEEKRFIDRDITNNKLDKDNSKPDKIQNKQDKVQNQRDKVKNDPKVPLVTYAQADAYGKNTILPLIAGLETARANLDWETLEKNYHLLSNELKRGTKIFYKVDGKSNREKLIGIYKVPAQEKRTELALPLSIYMGIEYIEAQLEADNPGKAAAQLEKIKILVEKLSNVENDALLTDLVAKVKALESKINATNATSYYEAVSL